MKTIIICTCRYAEEMSDPNVTVALQVIQTEISRTILKISPEDRSRNDVSLAQLRLLDMETMSQSARFMNSYRVERDPFLGGIFKEFAKHDVFGHQYRQDRASVQTVFASLPHGEQHLAKLTAPNSTVTSSTARKTVQKHLHEKVCAEKSKTLRGVCTI